MEICVNLSSFCQLQITSNRHVDFVTRPYEYRCGDLCLFILILSTSNHFKSTRRFCYKAIRVPLWRFVFIYPHSVNFKSLQIDTSICFNAIPVPLWRFVVIYHHSPILVQVHTPRLLDSTLSLEYQLVPLEGERESTCLHHFARSARSPNISVARSRNISCARSARSQTSSFSREVILN